MPLTKEARTIYGGCNCGSIRYRVSIPVFSSRALRCTPAASAEHIREHGTDIRFPMIFYDHCDDCRRATGSPLTWYMTADIHTAAFSFGPQAEKGQGQGQVAPSAAASAAAAAAQHWIPATEVLTSGRPHSVAGSPLLSYESSPGIRRGFCGTCGTNLTYHSDTTVEGFTEMLDLLLGTVDREYLVGLEPERHFFWDSGIDWVKKLTSDGAGPLPKHPGDEPMLVKGE